MKIARLCKKAENPSTEQDQLADIMKSLLDNHLVLWSQDGRLSALSDEKKPPTAGIAETLIITPHPKLFQAMVAEHDHSTGTAQPKWQAVIPGDTPQWLGPLASMQAGGQEIFMPAVLFLPPTADWPDGELTIEIHPIDRSDTERYRALTLVSTASPRDPEKTRAVLEWNNPDSTTPPIPEVRDFDMSVSQLLSRNTVKRLTTQEEDNLNLISYTLTPVEIPDAGQMTPDRVGPAKVEADQSQSVAAFEVVARVIRDPASIADQITPLPDPGRSVASVLVHYKHLKQIDDEIFTKQLLPALLNARFVLGHRNRYFANSQTSRRGARSLSPVYQVPSKAVVTMVPLLSRWDDFRLFLRAALARAASSKEELEGYKFVDPFADALANFPGALAGETAELGDLADEMAEAFHEAHGETVARSATQSKLLRELEKAGGAAYYEIQAEERRRWGAALSMFTEQFFAAPEPDSLAERLAKALLWRAAVGQDANDLTLVLSPFQFIPGDLVSVFGSAKNPDSTPFLLNRNEAIYPDDANLFQLAYLMSWSSAILSRDDPMDQDTLDFFVEVRRRVRQLRPEVEEAEARRFQRLGEWFTRLDHTRFGDLRYAHSTIARAAIAYRDATSPSPRDGDENAPPLLVDQGWRIRSEWFLSQGAKDNVHKHYPSADDPKALSESDPLMWILRKERHRPVLSDCRSHWAAYHKLLSDTENVERLRTALRMWTEYGFDLSLAILKTEEVVELHKLRNIEPQQSLQTVLVNPHFRSNLAKARNQDETLLGHLMDHFVGGEAESLKLAFNMPDQNNSHVLKLALSLGKTLLNDRDFFRKLTSELTILLSESRPFHGADAPADPKGPYRLQGGEDGRFQTPGLGAKLWDMEIARHFQFLPLFEQRLLMKAPADNTGWHAFVELLCRHILHKGKGSFDLEAFKERMEVAHELEAPWARNNGKATARKRRKALMEAPLKRLNMREDDFEELLEPLLTALHTSDAAFTPNKAMLYASLAFAICMRDSEKLRSLGLWSKDKPDAQKILNFIREPEPQYVTKQGKVSWAKLIDSLFETTG